jgi:hypothetical protein
MRIQNEGGFPRSRAALAACVAGVAGAARKRSTTSISYPVDIKGTVAAAPEHDHEGLMALSRH